MLIDLDAIIFISFLAINLAVGLFYSRGVKTIKEYAIGNRDFSTSALMVTLVATCIGGGFFTPALVESYRQGLYFIIPALGEPLALIITGLFLIPRMIEFFGNLSIADTMGKLYGKHVRVIVGIAGMLYSVGVVALQLKIAGIMMKLFFDMSELHAIIISATLVTLYSSFGGIKAVTFTDILQFGTFGIILPLICISIWFNALSNPTQVFETISNNPKFNFEKVFNLHDSRFFETISLFLFFIIPAGDPAYIQRIGAANGIPQAKKSFVIAGLVIIAILLLTCLTGVLLLGINPNLDPDNLLVFMMNNYTYAGFKGLMAVGIMAIIMSTADSYINSASVLLVNDIVQPLSINMNFNSLNLLRVIAVSFGMLATYLSYEAGSIFRLGLTTLSFYMPIVSVPMLLAIFGFRSSPKVVITGMSFGALGTLLWINFGPKDTNEIIPGMVANVTFFIIAHLIYGRPRGFLSEEYKNSLRILQLARKRNYESFKVMLKNFSLKKVYQENFTDKEFFYVLSGFFVTFYLFSESYVIKNLQGDSFKLFNLIYFITLMSSFILMIGPILPSSLKREDIIIPFRMFVIPFVLLFVPIVMSILNKFGHIQVIIMQLSALIFLCIVKWRLALMIILLTSCISMIFFNLLSANDILNQATWNSILKFKLAYLAILTITVFIAFLKPKQEAAELSEEMIEHLSNVVKDQNNQITHLESLKKTFIMNLQHETNTPITGVYSMSQALHDCYDKLTDQERKQAIATISGNAERLISYANNLIDISKIMNLSFDFKVREVNLSNLLEDCLRKCIKLYMPEQAFSECEITTNIEQGIKFDCDEYLIKRSFENIIINAIQYCKKGSIAISLVLNNKIKAVEFIVQDTGIGVPQEDLKTIFDPFTTSSKTTTPAGGRGIGLSFVKLVTEIHKGKVKAKSDGKNGSVFTMSLPILS